MCKLYNYTYKSGRDRTMRQRFKKTVRSTSETLILGIIYFIWLSITHKGIPCPFRLLTGYLCPGCGITHYLYAMIHLRLSEAFHANAFVFLLMPAGIIYWLYRTCRYIRTGRTDYSVSETIAFAFLLITAIAFCIHRNIP